MKVSTRRASSSVSAGLERREFRFVRSSGKVGGTSFWAAMFLGVDADDDADDADEVIGGWNHKVEAEKWGGD